MVFLFAGTAAVRSSLSSSPASSSNAALSKKIKMIKLLTNQQFNSLSISIAIVWTEQEKKYCENVPKFFT